MTSRPGAQGGASFYQPSPIPPLGMGASLISLVDRARMRPPTEAAQTEAPAERKARLGPRYRALPRGRLRESHLFRKMTILSGLRLQPQEMHEPLENRPPHGLEPA